MCSQLVEKEEEEERQLFKIHAPSSCGFDTGVGVEVVDARLRDE